MYFLEQGESETHRIGKKTSQEENRIMPLIYGGEQLFYPGGAKKCSRLWSSRQQNVCPGP